MKTREPVHCEGCGAPRFGRDECQVCGLDPEEAEAGTLTL